MTVLNTADQLYVGGQAVDRVYVGTVKVWPPVAAGPGPQERMLADTLPQTKASGAYTVAIRFTPTVNGEITHVRYWAGDSTPAISPRTVSVWTTDGVKRATAVDPSGPVTGWREAALPSPLAVQAGTLYIAGFSSGMSDGSSGEFGYSAPLPKSLAPHLTEDVAMNSPGFDQYPTSVAVGYTYHADVVFRASV
jgi:hypothetical protein